MKTKNIITSKIVLDLTIIAVASFISAVAFHVFIFSGKFAPTGLEAVSTFVQYLWGLNAGYVGLILNIPMLVIGYFFIDKKYVCYTGAFIIVLNLFLLLLAKIEFYQYSSTDGNYILSALFAGIIRGFACAVLFRLGGSTGGLDVIAIMIQKRKEHYNIEKILLALNIAIVVISYFVYAKNLDAAFLSIIYSFCYSKSMEPVLKGPKAAIAFNVVTLHSEEITREVIESLNHSSTIMSARGGYSGEGKEFMICVINKREIGQFRKILKNYDNTFAFIQETNDILGFFNRKTKKCQQDLSLSPKGRKS